MLNMLLHLALLLLLALSIGGVESVESEVSEHATLAEAVAQMSMTQEAVPPSPARRPLRIAQIAPLIESVPPKAYGGTERIIYYLVEEFAKRGHQVILFASSDSTENSATELVAHTNWDTTADRQHRWHATRGLFEWQMKQLDERMPEFDIVHFHFHPYLDVAQKHHHKIVSTFHGTIRLPPELPQWLRTYPDVCLVSISYDQRRHLSDPSVQPIYGANIYNGIPEDLYKFTAKPEGKPYLAFLGLISRNKGPDRAIQIAARAGIPLKIAAKLEVWGDESEYWKNVMQPMLAKYGHMVEFVGEINDQQKGPFLGNALALLFPIDWEEPFGIVMVEAMACGTPVVARRIGSVPEVIDEGVTGFMFDTIDEGVEAVKKIGSIDRAGARKRFEERFTAKIMADNYLKLFDKVVERNNKKDNN